MKQIQNIIREILRSKHQSVNKEAKIQQTSDYLAMRRRRFVAETPIGFKPRSSSDYFSQN